MRERDTDRASEGKREGLRGTGRTKDRWVVGGEKIRVETGFDTGSGVRISLRCSRGSVRLRRSVEEAKRNRDDKNATDLFIDGSMIPRQWAPDSEANIDPKGPIDCLSRDVTASSDAR